MWVCCLQEASADLLEAKEGGSLDVDQCAVKRLARLRSPYQRWCVLMSVYRGLVWFGLFVFPHGVGHTCLYCILFFLSLTYLGRFILLQETLQENSFWVSVLGVVWILYREQHNSSVESSLHERGLMRPLALGMSTLQQVNFTAMFSTGAPRTVCPLLSCPSSRCNIPWPSLLTRTLIPEKKMSTWFPAE